MILGLKVYCRNANDIIIHGFDEDGHNHDQALQSVLKPAANNHMKLNPSK